MGYIGVITHLLAINPNFLVHPSICTMNAEFCVYSLGIPSNSDKHDKHHLASRIDEAAKNSLV